MAKAKSEKIKSARTGKQSAASVTEEAIARRAYELFLQRAGENGRDLDDWLEAERLLTSGQDIKPAE